MSRGTRFASPLIYTPRRPSNVAPIDCGPTGLDVSFVPPTPFAHTKGGQLERHVDGLSRGKPDQPLHSSTRRAVASSYKPPRRNPWDFLDLTSYLAPSTCGKWQFSSK